MRLTKDYLKTISEMADDAEDAADDWTDVDPIEAAEYAEAVAKVRAWVHEQTGEAETKAWRVSISAAHWSSGWMSVEASTPFVAALRALGKDRTADAGYRRVECEVAPDENPFASTFHHLVLERDEFGGTYWAPAGENNQ